MSLISTDLVFMATSLIPLDLFFSLTFLVLLCFLTKDVRYCPSSPKEVWVIGVDVSSLNCYKTFDISRRRSQALSKQFRNNLDQFHLQLRVTS